MDNLEGFQNLSIMELETRKWNFIVAETKKWNFIVAQLFVTPIYVAHYLFHGYNCLLDKVRKISPRSILLKNCFAKFSKISINYFFKLYFELFDFCVITLTLILVHFLNNKTEKKNSRIHKQANNFSAS